MLDVIVIGAGAAGLLFSNVIDKNLNVLVLEKNKEAGKKLLITGGGRCNLTNNKENNLFLEEIKYNKKYLYSAIFKFGPKEVMKFFKVPLKEEKENQIFPVSNSSYEILEFLLKNKNCEIKYNSEVLSISKENNFFEVKTKEKTYTCKKLVIATGGSSFPALGSSGDNLKFAKMLNQKVTKIFPAETSVHLEKSNNLAGTSFEKVVLSFKKKTFEGNLIYTHKGISGLSVMKASEHIYLENIKEIKIDYLPNINIENILNENQEQTLISVLKTLVSKKFASYILDINKIDHSKVIKVLNEKEMEKVIISLKASPLQIKGVEDISKAYVTGGGIDLKDVNTKTFESKTVENLYFIGEALDLHGPVGGYNLTIAFSTAYSAAYYISEELK